MTTSCPSCALKKTCGILAAADPLRRALALGRDYFPPLCGGSLYVKAEPVPSRRAMFSQYRKPKLDDQGQPLPPPPKPRVHGLDDLG